MKKFIANIAESIVDTHEFYSKNYLEYFYIPTTNTHLLKTNLKKDPRQAWKTFE